MKGRPSMATIQTQRLTLKPHGIKYLHSTHVYASDPESTVYMMHLPNSTIEETAQFLRGVEEEWTAPNQRVYEYAIILDGTHIGAVSLYLDGACKVGELGWIINRAYHGYGYATEAANAVKGFAFSSDKFQLEKIVAHCDYRNTPSIRVMEKIGLTFERDDGMRRYKGSEEDIREIVYSLVVVSSHHGPSPSQAEPDSPLKVRGPKGNPQSAALT